MYYHAKFSYVLMDITKIDNALNSDCQDFWFKSNQGIADTIAPYYNIA